MSDERKPISGWVVVEGTTSITPPRCDEKYTWVELRNPSGLIQFYRPPMRKNLGYCLAKFREVEE